MSLGLSVMIVFHSFTSSSFSLCSYHLTYDLPLVMSCFGHASFKLWGPRWSPRSKFSPLLVWKGDLYNTQELRREIKKTLLHLHVGYRSKERATFRGNFLCNISIYSMLTFELCTMRGSFYTFLFPDADFFQAWMCQQVLVNNTAELFSCSLQSRWRLLEHSLVWSIPSHLDRKRPTELASARPPRGSKWLLSDSLQTH